MSIEITVKQIGQPKPGKKQGFVIDTENRRWQVYADKLHLYHEGGTYQILQTSTSNFNGQDYITIKDMLPVVQRTGNGPTPLRVVDGGSKPSPADVVVPAPQVSDDIRRMDIFVCGIVNATMSNPNVDPFSIEGGKLLILIERAKEAWRRTLGPNAGRSGKPSPQVSADLDDEIPFP